MSNARKLQTEIDRVMKKVDEGVSLFDEIWEKVYSAEQQNQKEKHEVDLKKEIKKLQRLRDQIKTWIGSSDVKDKDALIDARKLIETKMEQFKICEKETKTKTYSKEGLLRQDKLDPTEQAKKDCTAWIADYIEQLNQIVDEKDVEIERLSSGKGKKTNKHIIEDYTDIVNSHKFHISKLEGIMRLVNNDRLAVDTVEEIKEDLEYYLEAHEEEEYMQSYDEEIFYEPLGLENLAVVNVDRVTQAQSSTKSRGSSKDDDTSATSSSSRKKDKAKKSAAGSSMIPLNIGRARASSGGEKEKKTPTKAERAQSAGASVSVLGPTPSARAPPAPPTSGPSMAALLKKDSEQQEKERQQKAALQQAQQQRLLQEQQARAQAEQLRQQQLLKQQQEAQLRQQEAQLRQQQAAQQKAAQQEALKRQQQAQQEAAAKQQQLQQQQEVAKQQQLQQQQQQALQAQLQQQQQAQQQQSTGGQGAIEGLLTAGLGGLSLGSTERGSRSGSPNDSAAAISPNQQQRSNSVPSNFDATASYLGALNESFLHCPSNADSERQRTYTPRNPYPTPSSYPSVPSPIFDNPAVFEKLGTDCLFFIFYYAQGTYQQYLAARELKKQSWRYHKKYMTWFQRHEEPKVTTDEYEQGTYVYFDYETGWCQRIKSDFRFEYSFLEDSLH
uniref:CCR4-NOT transcription complex subunit 3 n=1 Tax=Trieres chinensis TaxID=1514140 RepID=A0A7S1ZNC6_TRICV|mmetsp:Transcript_29213/g.59747  ORF Transcript_29213/g.59747 Transcript_29213/m.59747 type:complete len:668 (+) Transcript_29213:89-2092(+)|eukprot:CAMPEP_0183298238 /NCGR_PEP_ID=MMETSP0160_2-20130417/5320_1 /TAXON_ID=2839 ORGANISM="Odontella Sinensis, Strain Grunow 1884" /NCGR_SAMPLE_ID=MMETSP0160_2 /ASSEMBLY_ACC=CAM_ASM_000250 /LENGTH=667 /DNA_ID=CAMNT_0025460231 /DNA_START=70 /DNA_END=2073 /DNA_ORIENTATION=-